MFSKKSFLFINAVCILLLAQGELAFAQKQKEDKSIFAGGKGSTINLTADAFSLPAANITKAHRKDFAIGRSTFRQNWVSAPSSVKSLQGLGPTFNAQSCVACHTNDGRGRPPLDAKEQIVGLLLRLSVPGKSLHGGVNPVPNYGDQFNPYAILGVEPEGDIKISYNEIKGKFPDGESFTLSKPTYKLENLKFGPMPDDVMISPRTAPAIIGLGLLEAISEKDILKNVKAEGEDPDGISGRPNYVWDFINNKKALGRFGWKANQPSVAQQDAGALNGDMGITTTYFKTQNCPAVQVACNNAYKVEGPEISTEDLRTLEVYSKTLAVPQKRSLTEEEITQGSKLMTDLTCVKCHIPHYKTGIDKNFPENSKQDIFPYTDLLLHDMGEELADHRPDYEASGREWRTSPLWGIGLVKTVNSHTRFLHDGRARSLEEAILWHGGEAEKAKQGYMNLKKQDRQALIKYVESL